eukprot:403362730
MHQQQQGFYKRGSFISNTNIKIQLIYLTALALAINITTCIKPLFSNSQIDQQIIQTQNLTSYLIELNETEEFELQNYFSGALLDYDYEINDLNGTWYFDQPFYKILITLTPPYKSIATQVITNDSYQKQNEPFPQSTILLPENDGTKLTMFMIDRNFIVYNYDVSDYSTGDLDLIYQFQLNTTIVNESCHDLTFLQYATKQQALMIFCRSMVLTGSGDVDYYLYTNVFIDLTGAKAGHIPNVYYDQYRNNPVFVDFVSGIIFIGMEQNTDGTSVALFLSNQNKDFWNPYYQQVIVKINITDFLNMKATKITYQYNLSGRMLVKYSLKYDMMYQSDKVISFGILSLKPLIIGLVFDINGVLLCKLTDLIYQPLPWSQFYPTLPCNTPNTSQLIGMDNALSLYKNPQDESYFYITMSSPPGVIEVNIDDPYNAYIFKQYQLPSESPALIGQKIVATNKNIIIHSMLNIETNEQVLRLYNRNASHYNIAKYNFILPQKSRSNYFYFPSYYQNNLLFRDEVRINVTTFFDYKLTLNATNYTWVNTFKYNIFQVNLTVKNSYNKINVFFNVTFVEQDFTQVVISGKAQQDQNIFYNCGDDSFKYRVTDLFDGPNFNISFAAHDQNDCDQGYCYFDIVNQNIQENFQTPIDDLNCDQSFVFLDDQSALSSPDDDPVLLVCIDNQNQVMETYKMVISNQSLVLLNQIEAPSLNMIFVGADTEERSLFVIAQIVDQDWITPDNEVHFFSIQEQIVWKNYTSGPIQMNNYDLTDLQIFSYNTNINMGVLTSSKSSQTEQIMLYFNVDNQNSVFTIVSKNTQKVDFTNQTIKVAISQEGFIYALQLDQTLNIYQVMEVNQEQTFVRLKQKVLDNQNYTPKQMDIQQSFFVIYYGLNEIYIYDIKNYVDLVYRMKLPLYQEYQDFQFSLFAAPRLGSVIHKSYYESFLSILMINPNYYGKQALKIFIFSLSDYQHNSLMMQKDVTEFFSESQNRTIVLNGNDATNIMILMSERKISMHQVEFFNYIQLRDNSAYKQDLLSKCSQHKFTVDPQGILRDDTIQISKLKLRGQSMFQNKLNLFDSNDEVSLNILSQNQGIAVTTTDVTNSSNNLVQVYFAYGDDKNYNGQSDYTLIVENLIEGYNMSYTINCSFFDKNGNIQDCYDKGITDMTQSTTYNFYIEFVTQNRQIIKSFTLGSLFIMFDSLNMITVQTLQGDDTNLDEINGMALDFKKEYLMQDKLGCNIQGYLNVYECLWIGNEGELSYTLYLAIYECRINETIYLKMAKIKIYDDRSDFEMNVLKGELQIPYRVIDIDRGNITVLNKQSSVICVTIGMSMDNPGSTSNIFYSLNLTIDIKSNLVAFQDLQFLSAIILDQDTFKIDQLLSIPNSNILIIVDSLYGIYLYDLDFQRILKQFDLRQESQYQDLNQINEDDFRVFTVAGNWPNQLHIISSIGIHIFNFAVDLSDKYQILPDYNSTLEPIQKRIIRYHFDQFDNELAFNDYGYSFLMTKSTSKTNYDVYLGVVSFYASSTSKLFKIIKVTSNQQCLSLNQENSLVSDLRDELAVSFVCNTQLYIVKTCLRPHYKINMSSYLAQSSRIKNGKNQPGTLQYNQYNITLKASNEFNQNGLNQAQVQITLYQKTYPNEQYPEFYLICIFMLCTAITLIMLLAVGGKNIKNQSFVTEEALPKMSFDENVRSSTQANHSSFVPTAATKLLDLQRMATNKSDTPEFKDTEIVQSQLLLEGGEPIRKKSQNKLQFNSLFGENISKQDILKAQMSTQFEMHSTEVQPMNSQLKFTNSARHHNSNKK